jgi:hypothetical protein
MTLVVSELTLRELEAAPAAVRDALADVPTELIEVLPVSPEADDLASAYISDGAIGGRMHADALHIALATVARVDVLVSWNFKHIVNLQRAPGARPHVPANKDAALAEFQKVAAAFPVFRLASDRPR